MAQLYQVYHGLSIICVLHYGVYIFCCVYGYRFKRFSRSQRYASQISPPILF